MRLLSVARQGINIFCGIMDIALGINNSLYYVLVSKIFILQQVASTTLSQRQLLSLRKKKFRKCQFYNCLFLEIWKK